MRLKFGVKLIELSFVRLKLKLSVRFAPEASQSKLLSAARAAGPLHASVRLLMVNSHCSSRKATGKLLDSGRKRSAGTYSHS